MSTENPIVVVKKYRVHRGDVLESSLPEENIRSGVQTCRDLNEMATLEAYIHPEIKEVHYLGEKGVVDYSLKKS